MKIRYAKSGGFAGMRTTGSLDTGTLPAGEAKQIEALVESAGFFSLPEKMPKPQKGADYLTYHITVDDGNRSHSIEVSEPSAPEPLRQLIHHIASVKKS